MWFTPQRETIMFYPIVENFSGFHWWIKHNASDKEESQKLATLRLQMYTIFQ